MNAVADLQGKLKASQDLIIAQDVETGKAKNALTISETETAALRRAIDADKMAIDAYKRAYEAEQTASDAYKHRAESAEGRVDKLSDQLSKSRKHTVMGTLGGIVVGAILHSKL